MNSLKTVENKIFDKRYNWHDIDKEKALSTPRVLDLIREACLIESYFGTYTAKMMDLFWYDVQATSAYTIEAFEAYTHYYSLRRYLDTVGYRPIKDEEVVALKEKDKNKIHDNEIKELVNFMATEHFAANFFKDLANLTEEPVLKQMLAKMSSEEVMHARFAFDLLRERMTKTPECIDNILKYAQNFQHVGAYVLPFVSNAKEDNMAIINQFASMIEELTGQSLTEYSLSNI
jgi:rubrerythrin